MLKKHNDKNSKLISSLMQLDLLYTSCNTNSLELSQLAGESYNTPNVINFMDPINSAPASDSC